MIKKSITIQPQKQIPQKIVKKIFNDSEKQIDKNSNHSINTIEPEKFLKYESLFIKYVTDIFTDRKN